jgi:rubrerythrin
MKIEEAITTAIEFERKVEATYRSAERAAKDPVGKRVFRVLADEEKGHIAYLEHCHEVWQKTGKVKVEALETAIPSKAQIHEGLARMKQKVGSKREIPQKEAELGMLQKALEAEKETSGFYKKMVATLSDEGQQLFSRFVEIEEGHVEIVQAEIDSVTGLGFWFDVPEFRLEAE